MIWTDSSGPRLLCTSHQIDYYDECEENIEEEEVWQDTQSVGDVVDWDRRRDVALINDEKLSGSLEQSILDDDGTRTEVEGYWTKSGVDYLMENQKTVHSMGTTTGKSDGVVESMTEEHGAGWPDKTCHDMAGVGVKSSCFAGNGDSGGPTYTVDSEGAWLVHMNQAGDDINGTITCDGSTKETANNIIGTPHYEIMNYFDQLV